MISNVKPTSLGGGVGTRLNSYEICRGPIVRRERTGRRNQQSARNEKFVELIANWCGDLHPPKELRRRGRLGGRDEHRTPIWRRFAGRWLQLEIESLWQ